MTTTIQYFEGSVTVGNPALLQTVDVILSYQNGVKLAHVKSKVLRFFSVSFIVIAVKMCTVYSPCQVNASTDYYYCIILGGYFEHN